MAGYRIPFNVVQAAIVTRLTADLSPTSVYSMTAPQGVDFPFVVVSQFTSTVESLVAELRNVTVTVETFALSESSVSTNTLLNSVVSSLGGSAFDLSSDGFQDVAKGGQEEIVEVFAEGSDRGVMIHGIVRYRMRVQDQYIPE